MSCPEPGSTGLMGNSTGVEQEAGAQGLSLEATWPTLEEEWPPGRGGSGHRRDPPRACLQAGAQHRPWGAVKPTEAAP